MPKVEGMGEFFDVRAESYDEHMRQNVDGFEAFYQAVVDVFSVSDDPLMILDLGIGTGLQLEGLFARLPNARITGIDLSAKMLEGLQKKYESHLDRIRLIQGSFLDLDLGCAAYDAVVSVMALHHHRFEEKVGLFRRIRHALKPGGIFVNGDYVVGAEEAKEMHSAYERAMADRDPRDEGPVHIDIPFTMEDEVEVLRRAGFDPIRVPYQQAAAAVFAAEA